MICKHCGADVSLSNFLLRKTSPEAVSAGNFTLFNTADVLVQELVNQVETKFKVILVNHASCSKVDTVRNFKTLLIICHNSNFCCYNFSGKRRTVGFLVTLGKCVFAQSVPPFWDGCLNRSNRQHLNN